MPGANHAGWQAFINDVHQHAATTTRDKVNIHSHIRDRINRPGDPEGFSDSGILEHRDELRLALIVRRQCSKDALEGEKNQDGCSC